MEIITTGGVGRGRGNATNVPERPLIEQVKLRPLLYDKAVKDYRKPGASDAAWSEVADALGTTVTSCKKRWKSLRDTFIKYYRNEVQFNNGENKKKQKDWNYYQDLVFLKQHVELFRLEEGSKDFEESYTKEFVETNDGKRLYHIKDDAKEVYEIRIAADDVEEEAASFRVKDDQMLDSFEEQLEDNMEYILETESENHGKDDGQHFEAYEEAEIENEEDREIIDELNPIKSEDSRQKSNENNYLIETPSPSKNIVDPDERYLMSCLPAFKSFTPQQNAYVRMEIERLFYEVKFGSISEPRNKRSRMS